MALLARYLTRLDLTNFRAFEHQSIELAPITIFVGPNNSGKSSILSAIRLLSQSLQSLDSEVPLLLGEFGTFRDVAFGNKSARSVGIGVGFTYRREKRGRLDVNFKYRAQRREVILRDVVVCGNDDRILLHTSYSKDTEKQVIRQLANLSESSLALIAKPLRFFHFLPRLTFMRMEAERLIRQNKFQSSELKGIVEVERISREASWLLQSVQYLGPFRDVPLRVYPFSGERPSVLGPTGRGATDILVADYFRRGVRKRELSNQVRSWFAQARIAKDIEVRAASDRHYEIKLSHPLTGEYENLADVGFGISQVLPVVVAGHNMENESIFLVEQPEIHLHPRAQAELGSFLLALNGKGVQSVIETHSEHLIMRLQRHVAEGRISPGDVAINYVGANEQSRSKQVVRLHLDENGIFKDDWPEGFFAERLKEALDIARAPLARSQSNV
jgi:hypothetical protein